MKKQMGDLLVDAGILTSVTLQRALERQRNSGGRLGEVLEDMGVITQEEIIQTLSSQFGFKRVSQIITHQFSNTVLDLVPAEIAQITLTFPLKLSEGVLYLAVNDPFDVETMDLLAKRNNIKVVPVLATRDHIIEAITYYYKKSSKRTDPRHKILVVDDDPKDLQIIELSLMNEGLIIKTTKDPLRAFALALEFEPDLIICDSKMPRHNGFELLKEFRADFRTEQLPFIMLTSSDTGEDEKKAVESDCIDFIPKPLNTVRIVSRVRRAIKSGECIIKTGFYTDVPDRRNPAHNNTHMHNSRSLQLE